MTRIFRAGDNYVIRPVTEQGQVIRTRHMSEHDKEQVKKMNSLNEIKNYLLKNDFAIQIVNDVI